MALSEGMSGTSGTSGRGGTGGEVTDFEGALEDAWSRHGAAPAVVADLLPALADRVARPAQLGAVARLATHLYAEHLADYARGTAFLEALRQHDQWRAQADTDGPITRGLAVLAVCREPTTALDSHSRSDRIAILATAAAAFVSQGAIARAARSFDAALSLAEADLPRDDPANRSLAVAGNNLAVTLEERAAHAAPEVELMLRAATTGLKYWRIAGTWLEEERAEYRLASSLIVARDPRAALAHAERCAALCAEHGAGAWDRFHAAEVKARALAGLGEGDSSEVAAAVLAAHRAFAELDDDDKAACAATRAALPGAASAQVGKAQ